MKSSTRLLKVISAVTFLMACAAQAANGVWTNAVSGTWSDTTKWAGGVPAGEGGTATFQAASGTYFVTNNLGTAVSLSGLFANTNAGNAGVWAIVGGTNEMIAPALITTRVDSMSVRSSTLSGNGDLTITGLGKFFLGDDNLYTGRTIISNGNARVARDSGFGPVPSVFQADAIILDNGGLENDDNNLVLTNHPNRGITVTANGGFIGCGYMEAGFLINSPVTGPGILGINYENCPVTLNNPANDYSGGTVVGTNGPGANPLACTLKLGQNEVLPHGSGKGGLKIGCDSIVTNTAPWSTLDLNGKTETVNTLLSGPRVTITSSVANQGRLIIGGLGEDSDYRGTLTGGATLEKQGAGALLLTGAALSGGTIAAKAGTVLAAGPNLASGTTVLLEGGGLVLTAPSGAYALSTNVLAARLLLATNSTLTIGSEAGTVVFAGIVTTNGVTDPEPVLTIANNGTPLLFGSAGTFPAVLDAAIASEGGLAFTNRVWLRRIPTATYSIASGTDFALDGAALLGPTALTLTNFSVRVVRSDSVGGDGSVTANAGTTVWFDTMRFANQTLTNDASATLSYANNVTLNTGTAGFTGAGTITYSGALTGTGNAVKTGTGDLLLTGTGSALAGEIQINAGRLLPANEVALGGATVRINGGRLTNPTGANLTLGTTPVSAQDGGFEVTAAGNTMTLNGPITGVNPVSKWGEGKLVLGGTANNTNFQLYVRGGAVELAKSGSAANYAVLNLLGIQTGSVVRLTGSNGNQIGGGVTLDGGTLDLNGLSETIGLLTNTVAGGTVTNGGAQAATLTAGEGGVSSLFSGRLSDGTSALSLAKTGTGTLTIPFTSLAYTGGTRAEGGTLRLTAWTPPTAHLAYWLDATDTSKLSLSNSAVTAWADSYTGGVNFTQSTLAERPVYVANGINGRPSVKFSDAGRNRLIASKSTVAQTVFIVCRTTSYGGLDGIWGQSGVDAGIRENSSTTYRHTGNSGNTSDFSFNGQMFINGFAGFTFTAQQPHILTAVSSNAVTWTTAVGDYWGSVGGYSRYFRGEIGEVLVYSKALGQSELATVVAYLQAKWFTGMAMPANQAVTVATGARLAFANLNLTLNSLAGGGTLAPEGGSTVALTEYANFTGTVSGAGTVVMQSTNGADGRFLPQDIGTVIRNNGTQAALLRIDGTGTNLFAGMIQNGSNSLGIVQSGTGQTYFVGTNSTYTGETRVEAGLADIRDGCFCQYVRFSPVLMRIGGSNYVTNQYQISEFQLMLSGQKLTYPGGTTAYAPFGYGNPAETPLQAIDGDVNTKFYSSTGWPNPVIVKMPAPIWFDGYRWYTANDSTGRDPLTWQVETSMDGVYWKVVDVRANQAITTTRFALAGTYDVTQYTSMNVFSDLSATTVATQGVLSLSRTSETIGALNGSGAIRLSAAATLGVNAFTNATFSGGITGTGTVVKTGAARQSLSGTLGFSGMIVIESGVLDLNGAVLTGVTNIVIKNGATLTGAATVNGNLTVTFENGGVYSGSLAVSGALTVTGPVKLAVPAGATYPYASTLFSYASADPATLTALNHAVTPTPLPSGHSATVHVTATAARLVIAPTGTMIQIQ